MVKNRIWQTLPDGELLYWPEFIAKEQADSLYTQLLNQTEWRQESIALFGKTLPQPRLIAWYGDRHYHYSGIALTAAPLPTNIADLMCRCEAASQRIFNTVLLNLYRNGQDSMGWHQDNEVELGINPVIASLSFGAARTFSLKHRHNGQTLRFTLEHGSLLVMAGAMQHYWKHALPKTKRVHTPRINLTFRNIA